MGTEWSEIGRTKKRGVFKYKDGYGIRYKDAGGQQRRKLGFKTEKEAA